jgi:hypothetical protein
MGAINPSKMPGPKRKARRDNTDFTEYAEGGKVAKYMKFSKSGKPVGMSPVQQMEEGGEVWDQPNPAKKHKKLSSAKKAAAKAAAKAAGRPYPNLIDNMRMARSK